MNSTTCPGISPEDEAETLWRRAYAVTSPSETATIYFIGGDTGPIKIGKARLHLSDLVARAVTE